MNPNYFVMKNTNVLSSLIRHYHANTKLLYLVGLIRWTSSASLWSKWSFLFVIIRFCWICSIFYVVQFIKWVNLNFQITMGCYEMTNEIKCQVKCSYQLACGHACNLPCHKTDDPDHDKVITIYIQIDLCHSLIYISVCVSRTMFQIQQKLLCSTSLPKIMPWRLRTVSCEGLAMFNKLFLWNVFKLTLSVYIHFTHN